MRAEIKDVKVVLKNYKRLVDSLACFQAIPGHSMTASGGSRTYGNHVEDRIINHVDIHFQVKKIERAIERIPDPQQRFIIDHYIIDKEYSRTELCDRFDISLRGLNNLKNRALLNFAKNYGLERPSDETKIVLCG
ncbi:hypothetical protein [Limosilactobacillus fermentum]|uniref:hypothetical protein n=1 Tax=Limosilactobacillus fermentum TaxID=1613 RepID=UPI003B66F841